MKVAIATLVLNEMGWLQYLYDQHKGWPGLAKWVFVEAADRVFAETNPSLVSSKHLSVDGTSEFLQRLQSQDSRVVHIPFGLSDNPNPALCKVAARQAYLDAVAPLRPDLVIVIDADEFYTKHHQAEVVRIANKFARVQSRPMGFRFRQRHIWMPPSIANGNHLLFRYEVTGGYWAVPHTRVWQWRPGMRYQSNHNTPEGYTTKNLESSSGMPECIHMGFASALQSRQAKHKYYVARGEGVRDRRQMYVDCRSAFETWRPGINLPHGAKVIDYKGPVPEVFQNNRKW